MDHDVAVDADQDQVGKLVFDLPSEVQWHPVVDVDVPLAKLTVCQLEVEAADLTGDRAALLS